MDKASTLEIEFSGAYVVVGGAAFGIAGLLHEAAGTASWWVQLLATVVYVGVLVGIPMFAPMPAGSSRPFSSFVHVAAAFALGQFIVLLSFVPGITGVPTRLDVAQWFVTD